MGRGGLSHSSSCFSIFLNWRDSGTPPTSPRAKRPPCKRFVISRARYRPTIALGANCPNRSPTLGRLRQDKSHLSRPPWLAPSSRRENKRAPLPDVEQLPQ